MPKPYRPPQHLAGLILAAGQGRRFGSDKRQARLPDGRTLLSAVVHTYAQALNPLVVVVPAGMAPPDAAQLGADINWVINPEPHRGMGHSLALGAQHLMARAALGQLANSADPTDPTDPTDPAERADLAGVIIGLADMPALRPDTLHAIQTALIQSGQAVVPRYQGRMGHPRGLPASWLPKLATLDGDQGARDLVNWQAACALDVDDPGVLIDIDTPQDLARLTPH